MAAVKITPDVNGGMYQRGCRQSWRLASGAQYFLAIYDGKLRMYKSEDNLATPPTEYDAANAPAVAGIWQIGAAINSNGLIGIVYPSTTTAISYVTFNTADDTWGSPELIANVTALENLGGQSIDFDSADIAHVTYNDNAATDVLYYTNRLTGDWTGPGPGPIAVSSTFCTFPTIIVNGSDIPIIVYNDIGPVPDVTVAALGNQNNATSFPSKTTIITPSDRFHSHSVAINPDGDLLVATANGPAIAYAGTNLILNKHLAASNWATWEAVDTIDATARNRSPSMTLKGSDIYILCDLTDTGLATSQGIWYWTNASGSWVSTQIETGTTIYGAQARWQYRNNPNYVSGGYWYLDYSFFNDTDDEQYGNYVLILNPVNKGFMFPRSW